MKLSEQPSRQTSLLSLIDTSAWIDFFRGREPHAGLVDAALMDASATVCGMVALELRQGLKANETRLLKLIAATKYLATLEDDFAEAGTKLARLREKGITVPSSDGLIAQLAIRHSVTLIANDKHFAHFRMFGLQQTVP